MGGTAGASAPGQTAGESRLHAAAVAQVRWHSVSSTREYEQCPRRYRYAYVDRLAYDRHVPASWRIGSAVHAALEAAYIHRREHPGRPLADGLPAALVALRGAWDDLELPYHGDSYRRAGRQVERALVRDVLDSRTIAGVELPLRDELTAERRIVGFLDLLLVRDETTLEVVDHKSGRGGSTPTDLAADFQLNLYGALVRIRWPAVTTVRATHHYTRGPDRVTTTLTDEGLDAARDRVAAAARRIAADPAFAPTPGPHCDHCPWRPRCPAG